MKKPFAHASDNPSTPWDFVLVQDISGSMRKQPTPSQPAPHIPGENELAATILFVLGIGMLYGFARVIKFFYPLLVGKQNIWQFVFSRIG